jgi:acyl dehydratase
MAATLSTNLEGLRSSVGLELAESGWLPVTQEDIVAFAEATGDGQWIHTDAARAQASPFGGTIAHGFLTLSWLSRMLGNALKVNGISMAVNYGLNRVRFPAPVPAGSKIRAHFTLGALKEIPGGAEALFLVSVERQGGDKPVCVAEWIIRYYL